MEAVKKTTRDAFGDEIVALGENNKDIYVIDMDIGKSCKTGAFQKKFPAQYVNVGIAEQNGAGVAAGLATTGKIPFVATYAVFGSLRMAEQIRQEICYPNLNVKIACSHGGLTPANDGASHQGIEDMGVLRSIPNMTVVMGADYNAARKLVAEAAKLHGPVYLRFTRDAIPVIYDENIQFTIGKAHRIQDKARNAGFDWKQKEDVWDKVAEELNELGSEIASMNEDKMEGERWMWTPSRSAPRPDASSRLRITTSSMVLAAPSAKSWRKKAGPWSSASGFRIGLANPPPTKAC